MRVRLGLDWIGIRWRRPGVAADVAWPRDGVEAPDFLACLGVQSIHPTADAVFTARHAGEDHPIVVTRRAGDTVAVFVVLELCTPGDLAGLLIESDEATVKLAGEDHAVAGRHAAVVPTAADQVVDLGDVGVVLPQLVSGLTVEGED